jgi:hypothetical protein
MGAAMVVIPLAALVVPIVLILAAVVVDIAAVFWALYRFWHDSHASHAQVGVHRFTLATIRRALHLGGGVRAAN